MECPLLLYGSVVMKMNKCLCGQKESDAGKWDYGCFNRRSQRSFVGGGAGDCLLRLVEIG